MTSPAPPPGVDYSRKWFVMIAISMGIFLGTIDGSIVNAALPTLVAELDTSFSAIQWVVLGYLLTQATLTLGIGRVGDMTGKRPIYTAGFGLFTGASMLCGIAPSVGFLIGFRILQGLGASMIFALGFAIITESFPPSERGKALGITGAIVSIGIAIGPALGGLIIDALSWRWVFFVNLPIGIIGTWTAWRFVPAVEPPGGQRFDFKGAFAFFVTLLSLMLALTLAQENGFSSNLVLSLLATSGVGLIVFVWVERRVLQPMLDFALFRNVLLTTNLIMGFLVFVAIVGMLILLPFYLQDVLGFSLRKMGFMLAIIPIGLGLVAPISGTWSDRIGPRPVLVIGLVVMLFGFVGFTTLSTDTSTLRYLVIALPVGIGIGIFQTPNNSAVMGSVPPERLGVTSGMLTITRITGQITGIAVLGTLWSGRVAARSGLTNPTDASPADQVAGLNDTAMVVVGLVAISLALALWSIWRDRAEQRESQPV